MQQSVKLALIQSRASGQMSVKVSTHCFFRVCLGFFHLAGKVVWLFNFNFQLQFWFPTSIKVK